MTFPMGSSLPRSPAYAPGAGCLSMRAPGPKMSANAQSPDRTTRIGGGRLLKRAFDIDMPRCVTRENGFAEALIGARGLPCKPPAQ
jgi:hypothetical protein